MKKHILDLLAAVGGKLVLPRCSVVLVAAGNATRMGGIDKIMAELNGKPMILRTAEAFQQSPAVQELVVVTRADLREPVETLLREAGVDKLSAVIVGGSTRTESVQKGVAWCNKKSRLIAVHDGARPLVTQAVIEAAVAEAAKSGAAVPALPVRDTIRVVEQGVGVSTPDRSLLYAMQTPQVFEADLLRAALQDAVRRGRSLTDDCAAVEAIGMRVRIVPGDEENLKVTTRLDLALANALARRRDAE